jgi:hypothetical protein
MRRLLAAAAVFAALSAGCYPNRLDSVDYDIVVSMHDSTANFAATTYYLNPNVIHLVAPGESDQISTLLDPVIINGIRTNMNARGYSELTGAGAETTADVRLLAAVSTNEYTAYYWDYWCGIYWYGCYYPPYYGTYTYTTGSLFVSMQDRRAPVGGDFPLIWLNIGNGLLGTGANAARVTDAINTMFAQSPYVDATP